MADENFAGWCPEKAVNVVTCEGRTRVLVKGQPYMSWLAGDEDCTRLAIVQIYDCGLGTQEELAQAFGRHVNSVRKYIAEFAGGGIRALMAERSGPRGHWKITAGLRGKILQVVLREGICKLEAIQQRLAEDWEEEVSLPSIQQVLEENGLREPQVRGEESAVIQGELFSPQPERQLQLSLDGAGGQGIAGSSEPSQSNVSKKGPVMDAEVGAGEKELENRRNYSRAQRIYLDQLEQGDYNAYAGGLLFVPLLARYDFLPMLRKVITITTYECYSLDELGLT